MTIRLDLCINSDPEFPYTQSSIYEVRMYGINAHTNAQKLKHIEIQFMLTQKTNYKIDEVQKTLALLDDYFSYRQHVKRYYWGNDFGFDRLKARNRSKNRNVVLERGFSLLMTSQVKVRLMPFALDLTCEEAVLTDKF